MDRPAGKDDLSGEHNVRHYAVAFQFDGAFLCEPYGVCASGDAARTPVRRVLPSAVLPCPGPFVHARRVAPCNGPPSVAIRPDVIVGRKLELRLALREYGSRDAPRRRKVVWRYSDDAARLVAFQNKRLLRAPRLHRRRGEPGTGE